MKATLPGDASRYNKEGQELELRYDGFWYIVGEEESDMDEDEEEAKFPKYKLWPVGELF